MKNRLLLCLFLLIIFFTPVNAKEEKYKIVSGDLETIGSEVCFDTECFYVIGNDGNVLRLLSKYNITVEEKPVQSADAKGIEYADEPYWGKTERKDAKYVYDSNSNLYKYVEAYKDSIIEKGVVVEKARLVNQEELYVGGLDIINYTWHTAKVRFESNFWSGVAYDDSNVWTSDLEQYGYDNPYVGISPVLEIPVGWFGQDSVYVGGTNFIKSSDGVISNNDATVDLTFNDLEQEVKYQTIIYNNTDKAVYVNDIDVDNLLYDFIEFKLDKKSENMLVEPGGSSLVAFYVKTLDKEAAGKNLSNKININFILGDKALNPDTFSNILEIILLISLFVGTVYFIIKKKNRKAISITLIICISFGIIYASAADDNSVTLVGNIKYVSQNVMETTGTTMNKGEVDYSNSKDVWTYFDFVKNIEIMSSITDIDDAGKERMLINISEENGRWVAYSNKHTKILKDENPDIDLKLKIGGSGSQLENLKNLVNE